MPTFTSSLIIHAERTALFALTQDYPRRLEWDPYLKEARLIEGACEAGIGTKAWCAARSGMGMETVNIAFRPPAVVAIKMTRGPWVLEQFVGSWRFETVGPQETRVTFRYNVVARPHWLRPLLDLFLKAVFARDMRQRLQALKKSAEETQLLAHYSKLTTTG